MNEVQDNHSVAEPLGSSLSIASGHHHDSLGNSSAAIGASSPPSFASGYYATIPNKYQENGDALSDFVNLVCQEAQHPGSDSTGDGETRVDHRQSPTAKYYNPMASMLPPPPPAPMARPVPIICKQLDGNQIDLIHLICSSSLAASNSSLLRSAQNESCSPDLGPSSPSPGNPGTPGSDHSGQVTPTRSVLIHRQDGSGGGGGGANGAGSDSREPTPTPPPSHSSSNSSSILQTGANVDAVGINSVNRSLMSPFTTLTRADHSFVHVHSPVSQVSRPLSRQSLFKMGRIAINVRGRE